MKKVCPSCGKETYNLYDGLCLECFLDRNPILFGIKDQKLKICKICGKINVKNKWREVDKNVLRDLLKGYLKLNDIYELRDIIIRNYEVENNIIKIYFTVLVRYYDKDLEEDFIAEIDLKQDICEEDDALRKEGYDTILQIRGGNYDKRRKFFDIILNYLQKEKISIHKIEELREGIDIYAKNSYRIKKLLEKLKRQYNYELKYSRKLHTFNRQTSKRVYKLTISVRLKD